MKKLNIIYLLLMVAGFSFTSCNDYLEETSQDLSYINSLDDLDELLLGEVYLQRTTTTGINDVTGTYLPYVHFMADELDQVTEASFQTYYVPNSAIDLFGYYTWQRQVSLGTDGSSVYDDAYDWTRIYKCIVSANVVLEELDKLQAKDEEAKIQASRIKGEALFNRATDFFLLVNLFGDAYQPDLAGQTLGIPLKLTEYAEIGEFTRASVKEVYAQILSDLNNAEEALRDIPQQSIYRINHAGVCLFLSRVYLYMQDYDNAIVWAQKCLDEAPEVEDLNSFATNLFSEENRSVLFTMGGNIIAENIYEDNTWGTPQFITGQFYVSQELYNSFEDNDLRKSNFFHVTDIYPGIPFYDKQYSDGISSNTELSDCFTLRTAEAWLNLAEAYAVKGETTNAQAAIDNLLKNRIEASGFESVTKNGEELVHFIRDERRKELCMEGHRWFDLRRYQANIAYPQTKTLYSSAVILLDYELVRADFYMLEPNDPAWTLPLPVDESEYNASEGNERYAREPYDSVNY